MTTLDRDFLRLFPAALSALAMVSIGIALAASIESLRPLLSAVATMQGVGRGIVGAEAAQALAMHAFAFAGSLLAAAVALHWQLGRAMSDSVLRQPLLLAGCVFVGLYWTLLAVWTHTAVLDGVRYWWLSDDQMIAMRYARNLIEGHGLVWNPGERVEGFSNPLWTFYMVLVHGIVPLPPEQISVVILASNVLLAVAAVPLILRLVEELGGTPVSQLLTVCMYAVCAHALYMNITGWEQALLLVLTLLATLGVFEDIRARAARWQTCLLLGIIALVRVDAALISTVLGMVLLFHAERRFTVFMRLAVGALIPFAYVAFRLVYYGDFVPNTYYLKVTGWNRIEFGTLALVSLLKEYALVLVLAFLGLFTSVRRREYTVALVLVGVQAAYLWWSGGGFGSESRKYLVPVFPVLFSLATVTLVALTTKFKRPLLATALAATALFIGPRMAVPGWETHYLSSRMFQGELQNVEIGKALQSLGPDALVVDGGAGQVYYFGGNRGHDYLGVNDRYIARRDPVVQIPYAGHSKFDFDYSIGTIKPDYVVSTLPADVEPTDELVERWASGDWPFVGLLFQHKPFVEYCLPNPMPWQTPRIVYRCIWPGSGPMAD